MGGHKTEHPASAGCSDGWVKVRNAWDEAKSGGIILDMMIHDLNLLIAKYGPPEAIEDVKRNRRRYEIDDNVEICLRFTDFTAS
jgi:predicted dehydrogenase